MTGVLADLTEGVLHPRERHAADYDVVDEALIVQLLDRGYDVDHEARVASEHLAERDLRSRRLQSRRVHGAHTVPRRDRGDATPVPVQKAALDLDVTLEVAEPPDQHRGSRP
jgi:hypothetical protein